MRRLSILIGCYGNYPQYSIRAISSVLSEKRDYDIHVGCSECCKETVTVVNNWLRRGMIDSAVICNKNINKDPMMRLLRELVVTPYTLWMDDDSHFISKDWYSVVNKELDRDFDCLGHVFYFGKSDEYNEFLKKRPWWRGDEFFLEAEHKEKVFFATGGLWIAKTELLTKHDFPDKKMIKKADDLLLGDLISQHHYKLINFSKEVMDVIRISDGDRRGGGEDNNAWK